MQTKVIPLDGKKLPETQKWAVASSAAFVDHIQPMLREAAATDEVENVLNVYSGALGAWWGSLVHDFGFDQAQHIAETLFSGVININPEAMGEPPHTVN